jgi:superfamily II DNA/RNA helicase
LQPYAAALAAKKIPYAIFHGGMTDADRKRAVADYNANRIRALLIAPAGSEGISLKGTSALQLLDPHWNEARLDQAIGRGIRFDSHTDLPPDQRKVRVQRFLSELPPGVLSRLWRWAIQTKPGTQMSNPGTDFYLENMARKKQQLNDQFLDELKQIGTPKVAATGSFYLDAIPAVPLNYDRQQGVLQNVLSHLQRIRARGDRAITEAESWDKLQNAADPNRSIRQTQEYLAGKPSLVAHPLDRLLHGVS